MFSDGASAGGAGAVAGMVLFVVAIPSSFLIWDVIVLQLCRHC